MNETNILIFIFFPLEGGIDFSFLAMFNIHVTDTHQKRTKKIAGTWHTSDCTLCVCVCKDQIMFIADKGLLFALFLFILLKKHHRFQHALNCKNYKLYLKPYPYNANQLQLSHKVEVRNE